MKTLLHIIQFEWKSLWRSNILKVLLLVVLGAGIYGIYFGKHEIDKQKKWIAQVAEYEERQFDSLMVWAKLDTTIAANKGKYLNAVTPQGVGWNKHFTYYVTNPAPALAGLCLGQRDLFPVYYGFNITDLARQINVGELANPMKLLTGNFDLSYVMIFLLPILIVGLFYNLYAQEKEGGTLPLLRSQSVSLKTVLFGKGLLRLSIVWVSALLLLVLAFVIQGISFLDNVGMFLQWFSIVAVYCLFWTLLLGIIISLRHSSALSAILGLGTWLVFTLITPTLLNLSLQATVPLPDRSEAIHAVRTLNDRAWESPKSYVFERFHPNYPQYNDGDTISYNKWYYANFTLLDKKANALKTKFEEQVSKRTRLMQQWEWLAPAAKVHETLSRISGTDRQRHLQFVQRVHEYHNELKDSYYPKIFAEKNFDISDLKELKATLTK